MSDEKALLAAIWEHPHEDTPRLMFADWLQETEKPANVARAEFIRVQCALAKLAPWDDDPQRTAWRAREAELWRASEKAFRRGLAQRLRKDPFRRGFVDPRRRQVGFAVQFLKLTDAQFAEAPLWAYQLFAGETDLPKLFAFRGMKRVGQLTLHCAGRKIAAEQIAQCEHLGNLTALEWEYSFAGAAGLRALGAARNVPHLTRLKLDSADMGEAGAAAFGESRLVAQVTELSIRSNKLTPEAAESLFAPGKFRKLASLEMGYEDKGNGVLAALTTGDRLPALRHLRLVWMKMTATGAKALAEWPGAASLRHLEVLWSNEIGVSGVRHLVRSPHLRNLLALDVTPYAKDEEAVTELLRERFGTAGPAPDDEQYTVRGGRLPDDPEPVKKPHATKKRK